MNKQKFIVMGVSGCGKSLISSLLAEALGLIFFDGDDFHPLENIEKMRQGEPLNDQDRREWLLTLNRKINQEPRVVVACSGLKPHYREQLLEGNDATIIYLKGDFETIWQRHQQREGHYFKGRSMLESQFGDLSEPTGDEAISIDIAQPVEKVFDDILLAIGEKPRSQVSQ